jgi:hypothetical protein
MGDLIEDVANGLVEDAVYDFAKDDMKDLMRRLLTRSGMLTSILPEKLVMRLLGDVADDLTKE